MSDAPKPWDGVPRDPERDGWHWLYCEMWSDRPHAKFWNAKSHGWGRYKVASAGNYAHWRYLGPCHTPSEVATLTSAAWQAGWAAGREAAGKWHRDAAKLCRADHRAGCTMHDSFGDLLRYAEIHDENALAIRALLVPPAPITLDVVPDPKPDPNSTDGCISDAYCTKMGFRCCKNPSP